ncbi:MAG: TIR domain-containing protein [Christensenellaceae bacterium]|nr:TIR domain-containing protein [Christensenellaceae bacterium]
MKQIKQWHYEAFISYRHLPLDIAAARSIHAVVERFRVPKWTRTEGTAGKKRRAFRDQEELPTSADLGSDIDTALRNSRFLVVICSPELLESRWCLKEIDTFISIGRKAYILPVLIAGDENSSIPESIRDLPVCLDARAAGKFGICQAIRVKKAALLSPMLGVEYEQLERSIASRRWTTGVAVFVIATALTVGVGVYATSTGKIIQKQNDELIEATEKLRRAEAIAIEERDAAYVSRSSFLAESANLALSSGKKELSAALVLQALPQDIVNPEHVYSPDALAVLRALYYATAQSTNEYRPLLHIDFGFKVAQHSESEYDHVRVYSPELNNFFAYYNITTGERLPAEDPILLTETPLTVKFDRDNFICAGYSDRLEQYVGKGNKGYEDGIKLLTKKAEPGADIYINYRLSESGGPRWDIYYGAQSLPLTISRENHPDGERTLKGEPFPCDEVLTFGSKYLMLAYQTRGRNSEVPKAAIFDFYINEALTVLDTDKCILKADYARNDTSVATIDENGTLKLWDTQTGLLIRIFDEQEHFIALDFLNSSTQLLAITQLGEGILYNALTGERLYTINEGAKMLCARTELSMGYLAAGFDDGFVRIYDVATGKKLMEVQNDSSITEVTFAEFDNWLYIHNADRLMVWGENDAGNTTLDIYKLTATQKEHSIIVSDARLDSSTKSVRFSRDGKKVIICGYNNNYGIYDTKTGDLLSLNTNSVRYTSNPSYIGAVFNFDETGVWVTSGADKENALQLYDATSGELLTTLIASAPDPTGKVKVFHAPGEPQYTPDGKLMMIEAPYDEGFCVFDANTFEYLWGEAAGKKTYDGSHEIDTPLYQKATLSADGKTVAILRSIYTSDFYTNIYKLEFRRIADGKLLSEISFSSTNTGYEGIQLSPDFRLVACYLTEKDVREGFMIIDTATGETLLTHELEKTLNRSGWTADSRALVFSNKTTDEWLVYGVDGTLRSFTYDASKATRLLLKEEDIFAFGEYTHVYIANKSLHSYVPSSDGRYLIDLDTGDLLYDAGEFVEIAINPNGENICIYSKSFFGPKPRLLPYQNTQEQKKFVEKLADEYEFSADELERYALGDAETEAVQ